MKSALRTGRNGVTSALRAGRNGVKSALRTGRSGMRPALGPTAMARRVRMRIGQCDRADDFPDLIMIRRRLDRGQNQYCTGEPDYMTEVCSSPTSLLIKRGNRTMRIPSKWLVRSDSTFHNDDAS